MAIQKALITNKSEFVRPGVQGAKINPFIYSNQEDIPGEATVVGAAPTFVDGVRGKAVNHAGATAFCWRNWNFPGATKTLLSLWVTPTAADLSGWKIIATHRGDGWGDRGIHFALYNGKLNVRAYGSNGSVNLYTDGGSFPLWTLTAGTTYHVAIVLDESAADTQYLKVYVDKQLMMYSHSNIILGAFQRSFTVGDMLSSAGGLQYTFNGTIDEVIYAQDSEIWDEATLFSYYDAIIAKNFIDYWTEPGSIQLPKDDQGNYISSLITWESNPIDLGAAIGVPSRVQLNYDKPDACTINLSTRTSDDGVTWDSWEALREDGFINSTDRQFIQIKSDLLTNLITATPKVEEIQILAYAPIEKLPLTNEPLKIYKDLASGFEYAGELRNAYDIEIEEEINGEVLLNFKLPINDVKRKELGDDLVELIAEIGERRFIIREVIDERSEDGKLFTLFKCEAFFYELRDFKVMELERIQASAYSAMSSILQAAVPSTGWSIAKCDIPGTKLRDFKIEWKSVLASLRDVVDVWGGELVFDEVAKEISLVLEQGVDNGVRFYYNKNLKRIVRNLDTYELVTRLYPQGKNGLDITTVNNGLEYLEDTTWVDALGLRNRIRIGNWKNEAYIYPQNLKDDAETILADVAKPKVSYAITVQDLSILSGHEHESFALGDTVYTVDKELLSTEVKSRIVRRKLNVREPWKTVAELAQPKKLLSDAMKKAVEDKMEYLESSEMVNTSDAMQMTVFNYLLNSRADEGLTEWLQEGTSFGLENQGFSGNWSFKCTGAYGETNKLTQRIYGISHRTSYTVSAAVAKEGKITRGGTLAEPFVGMKVIVRYTDGTTEEKLLAIEDTTTTT